MDEEDAFADWDNPAAAVEPAVQPAPAPADDARAVVRAAFARDALLGDRVALVEMDPDVLADNAAMLKAEAERARDAGGSGDVPLDLFPFHVLAWVLGRPHGMRWEITQGNVVWTAPLRADTDAVVDAPSPLDALAVTDDALLVLNAQHADGSGGGGMVALTDDATRVRVTGTRLPLLFLPAYAQLSPRTHAVVVMTCEAVLARASVLAHGAAIALGDFQLHNLAFADVRWDARRGILDARDAAAFDFESAHVVRCPLVARAGRAGEQALVRVAHAWARAATWATTCAELHLNAHRVAQWHPKIARAFAAVATAERDRWTDALCAEAAPLLTVQALVDARTRAILSRGALLASLDVRALAAPQPPSGSPERE